MDELGRRYLAAKRRIFDKYYSDLNPEQRRAGFTINRPLLILAGAGSGKTTVLVRRIAYIIRYGNAYMSDKIPEDLAVSRVSQLEAAASLTREQLADILPEFIESPCPPYRILAFTFTNKAANEIKSRLAAELGEEYATDIWAGTFHSVCLRILRTYTEAAGLLPGFSIYDTEDTKRAVAAAMKRLNIDEKTLPISSVIKEISHAKDKLIGPGDFADGGDFRKKQIGRIYGEYQSLLATANALDFDDIIFRTVNLLRGNEEVRRRYQSRFLYVSVDEYQDTNEAQFVLTELLSGGHRNIMVVGDDDQSIYRFRGATIANILGFDRHYPDAGVVKLEQNYRSAGNILGAANAIISNNRTRREKELWTDKPAGELISVCELDSENDEAKYIVDTISRLVRLSGRRYRDFAVLYRMNAQSRALEEAFTKSGLPYRTIGAIRFFDRKEIRDIVAYLNVLQNRNDSERLKRIINEPKRKIGERTVEEIERLARAFSCGMFDIIENASRYAELSRAVRQLGDFAALINRLSEYAGTHRVSELIREVVDASGYRDMLLAAGDEGRERQEHIDELVSGALDYEARNEDAGLAGYLEEVALVSDIDKYDESADAVVLMTVHSAKGLEFPVVFLAGMEEEIFPGIQAIMRGDNELEEERRLAYVAVTRAKEKLYILHAARRMLFGRTGCNQPSRFIDEIPPQHIERTDMKKGRSRRPDTRVYYSEKPRAEGTCDITINRPLVARQKPADFGKIAEGDRVRHNVFGEGEVLAVRKMGADILYEVAFDRMGTKKIMASYAKLEKII